MNPRTLVLTVTLAGCSSPATSGHDAGGADAPAFDAMSSDAGPDAEMAAERRRAYLRYYAPLILKSADEGDTSHWGFDWVTNFDFDRDGMFSTNKNNWEEVDAFVADSSAPAFANWQIRPTLYSAAIEFANGSDPSMILLYHVYHAKEEYSIHDWERIEVRVDHVGAAPGAATESVAYVTITEHDVHRMRQPGSADLNFMTTASGKHAMIWQAEWSAALTGFYRQELHFVETPWATLASELATCPTCNAEVDVNGTSSQKDVHYFFVPDGDAEAVTLLGAQTLTAANAGSLAAKATSTFDGWPEAKRIRYELQDLADIMPTHADCTSCGGTACVTEQGWQTFAGHWTTPTVGIWLDTPTLSETGTLLVPASSTCNLPVTFYRGSLDVEDATDGAEGYPNKHWFWGAYRADGGGETSLVFDGGGFTDPVTGTPQVRDCEGAAGMYWCQHDYYAHDGQIGSGDVEYGHWLANGWHTDAAGGFDGRWVQLFPD